MKNCYIYTRVSTKDQEREGYSIPAQLELLRAYALKHGLEVTNEFTESETAGKAGRTQFSLMISELINKKGPKIVLVEKTDRLTRNLKDYVLIDELASEHSVEFHLVKESEVIGQNATSHTKLIQGIKVVLAKNYIDNLKEETKKGILQKIKQGGWSWQAPYGYKMVKGELVIDPEKSPYIIKAFDLYSQGCHSLDSLRGALFELGYSYRGSNPKAPKTQLHNMLTNPLYKGEVHYQGVAYKGRHEALVTPQQWKDTQKHLRTSHRHKGRKYDFLFQHVLTCGECGSLMCGEEKRGGRYIYYRCWKTANSGCDAGYINEQAITAQLDAVFSRLQFPIDYKVEMKKAYYELKHAKQNTESDELARLNRERNRIKSNLSKVYEDKIEGVIDGQLWRMTASKYESQLLALDESQSRITKAEIPYYELFSQYLELPELLSDTWESGDRQAKADLVKMITSNISIKTKKVTVVLAEPFDYFYKEMVLNGKYPTLDELITTISLHSQAIQTVFVKLAA